MQEGDPGHHRPIDAAPQPLAQWHAVRRRRVGVHRHVDQFLIQPLNG
jgi:hypothetical protein